MAPAERTAQTVWEGDLPDGRGTVTLTSSGAARELPVTWGSRAHVPESASAVECAAKGWRAC
jgi:osmotically inducible protein OsmC